MAYSLERREEFLRLICSGASFVSAVDAVGVACGTGRSWWRQSGLMDVEIKCGARGGLAGSSAPACPGSGRGRRRALTSEDRAVIAAGLQEGLSYARIGVLIGRDKSVVCREVARHRGSDGSYFAAVAHRAAHETRACQMVCVSGRSYRRDHHDRCDHWD